MSYYARGYRWGWWVTDRTTGGWVGVSGDSYPETRCPKQGPGTTFGSDVPDPDMSTILFLVTRYPTVSLVGPDEGRVGVGCRVVRRVQVPHTVSTVPLSPLSDTETACHRLGRPFTRIRPFHLSSCLSPRDGLAPRVRELVLHLFRTPGVRPGSSDPRFL